MNTLSPVVFVVDDETPVRVALSRLLSSVGYAVEAYDSAQAFLQRPRREHPACLVLDVQMPGLSGLDLQRALKGDDAMLPIIFLTGHGDIPTSVRAMKDGATDFLTKPVDDEALIGAIGRAFSAVTQQSAQRAARDDLRRRIESLTLRERQVMELVVAGRLNKQIADTLGIVEKTVKVHRARVMEKMQAASLADLVRSVEKAGMPAPPSN